MKLIQCNTYSFFFSRADTRTPFVEMLALLSCLKRKRIWKSVMPTPRLDLSPDAMDAGIKYSFC